MPLGFPQNNTMERDEFLKLLGTGTLAVCAGCALESCSKDVVAPPNVDFTLDLTVSPNMVLQTPGGSLSKSGVIVARISTAEFAAVSQACTHEGTAVEYQPAQQNFHCPNHGSNFSKTGGVLNGPASSALRKYNTELNGNNLRVFS